LTADDDGKRHVVPAAWGLPSEKRPIINVRGAAVRNGSFKSRKHALAIVDGCFERSSAASRAGHSGITTR
jgi:hypothetical protein